MVQPPPYPNAPPGPSQPWAFGAAESAQNFVHLGRLLTLVLLILELVVGIFALVVSLFLGLFYGAFFVVGAVVGFVVYSKLGEVESQIGAGEWGTAKDGLVIWVILAAIFLWLIPGIILLLAYSKLDEAVRGTDAAYGYSIPGYPGTPPPGPTPPTAGMSPVPAAAPAPLPPPPPPAAPLCPTCRQPMTSSPYGRYYCDTCQRYL